MERIIDLIKILNSFKKMIYTTGYQRTVISFIDA